MYDFYINNKERKAIELDFGGTSPSGETLSIDSISYKKNGKACIPITGEFPYARYSECEWEKGLRKMKAGGIEMVSSYVFWIYHEEEQGIYRFDGDRNIRKFAELCQKVGLTFMLRIGPWVTGECKNGGFPDWVLDLPDVHGKVHGNTPQF
ncbi:MAG: beta-galactosidase, partial [Clostridia bacterium]